MIRMSMISGILHQLLMISEEPGKGAIMTVGELEEFLKTINDKGKLVYFYEENDNPFDEGMGIENAFEVLRDAGTTGAFEGVYLKGNYNVVEMEDGLED